MATPTFFKVLFSINLNILIVLLCFLSKDGHALERRIVEESNFHSAHISTLTPPSVCKPSIEGASRKASLRVFNVHGPCNQHNQQDSNKPTLIEVLSKDQSRLGSIQNLLTFNTNQNKVLFKDKSRAGSITNIKSFNIKQNSVSESKVSLPVKPGLAVNIDNYLITVGIGTPKRDFTLSFDTGSDFTWIQCQPCMVFCYKQKDPIYDPLKSSTYSNISCSSDICSELFSATGTKPGCLNCTCVYGEGYADKSVTIGYLVKDKLTLSPTDVYDGFLFGCGQDNNGTFGDTAGLLGLGRNPLSIVSQTAQKYGKFFSYCLPTMSEHGHLTFGKEGVPSNVKFTPFSSSKSNLFYYVDIEGISVAGQKLSIDSSVFQNPGTIVDSGTTITRLPATAYSALRAAFRQHMTQYKMTPSVEILDTCYDFSNLTTISFPGISFFFNGNVTVDLDSSGILVAVNETQACLAFVGNSNDSGLGVFGSMQQQRLEMVYDVAGGKLGFGALGCS